MDITQYLETKIENQINWFESHCKYKRIGYHFTKVLLMYTIAITPTISSFLHDDNPRIQFELSVISILTVMLANINTILNFKDK